MPKFILRPLHVQNLGGYIVETYAKLPYRDVVIGNPTNEHLKIEVPVYSEETLKGYEKQGIIVLPVYAGDSLGEAISSVRAQVQARAHGSASTT
jgi:energy-converting hydrogenase B subunit P